jgi:hypothetical protein
LDHPGPAVAGRKLTKRRFQRRYSKEWTMFRKLSLVAIAAASLGAAALAPTSASAWGGYHGGWYRHGGPRIVIGGPAYFGGGYAYGGCYVRRLVPTPWGPQWRTVNRCY